MRKPFTIVSLASAALIAAGCATQAITDAEEGINRTHEEAARAFDQGRSMSPRPARLIEEDGYYLLGEPEQIGEWARLPATLKASMALVSPDPVPFTGLLARISREAGVRVVLTSDAITYLSGATGALSDATSAAPSGNLQGMRSEHPDLPVELGELSADELANLPPDVKMALNVGEARGPGQGFNQSQPGGPMRGDGPATGAASALRFPIDYEGTVAGLLDHLTARTDLFWEWAGDYVEVFRLRSQNYHLDVAKTSTSVEAEMSSDRSSADDAGGRAKTKQSVEMTYEAEDVYDDILSSVRAMVNEDGYVEVSAATGIMSVTATPSAHKRIAEYVRQVNKKANRQIAIDVKIYELRLRNGAEYGIDWSMVFSGSERVAAEMSSNFSGESPNLNFTVINPTSRFVDSMAAVAATNQDIQFGVVTSNSGVTKNGRALSIQTADEIGYLEEVEMTPGDEGSAPTYSMKQSSVLEGMTMSVLPRLLSDGSIDMQVALDISKVNSIDEVRMGEGDSQVMIQTPNLTSKDFINVFNTTNGEPIMMSGMERVEESADTTGIFSQRLWFLGGKREGGKTKVMNMIVLTPYVMK